MTREEKINIVNELTEKLKSTDYFYIADSSAMTVAEVNQFRRECFKNGIEYVVYKNTLIKKALENLDTDYSEFDQVLKGFSGIMFSPEVGNLPAKVLKTFREKAGKKETPRPILKGASIDTAIYVGDDQLDALSKVKSKQELLGELIGLLQSPAKNVVSALKSGGQTIAGILKTLEEREA